MISAEARACLWDAREAAERIARFTAGRTAAAFLADDMMRAAVERQFEIIGEAFTRLRRVDLMLAATIPNLPQAIAFRNVLAHGYTSAL